MKFGNGNNCIFAFDMKRRITEIVKYLVVCLAFAVANKAADYCVVHDSDSHESASEIRLPETNLTKTEYSSFSMPENQCRIPRQSNFISSVRTCTQAHRNNHSNHSRQGFTLTKSGKSTNEYTTKLFLTSLMDFPSGMNESNHHLIGLRKLLI